MMSSMDWKRRLQSGSLALMVAVVGSAGLLVSPAPVHAQSAPPLRGLPDFTELVEQVGPSVVNIRTTEKVSARPSMNGMDEEMLEFFKRFGIPMPKIPRQQGPQRQQPEEQPRGVGGRSSPKRISVAPSANSSA